MSDKKEQAAHRAKDAKAATDEADMKRMQTAKIQLYKTAATVANQKVSSFANARRLGEQAERDLSVAQTVAEVNDKRAQRADAQLRHMISDASLDKLRNGMAKLTQARGTAKENAKLNNWYSAFKTEKA